MSSLIVYKLFTDADDPITDRREQVQAGMQDLAISINDQYYGGGTSTKPVQDCVDDTVRKILQAAGPQGTPKYKVTYVYDGQERQVSYISGKFRFPVGSHIRQLKFKAKEDNNGTTRSMEISFPAERQDLLSSTNYLQDVVSDLNALGKTTEGERYLLGTILFRRCR